MADEPGWLPQPGEPNMDLLESTWGPDGPVARPGRIRAWLCRRLSGVRR